MEKKYWIWLIVIVAFVILTIWALVVMFNSVPEQIDGEAGVVISADGDTLPDDSAAGASEGDVDSLIEGEIVAEEDDLDLGEVI